MKVRDPGTGRMVEIERLPITRPPLRGSAVAQADLEAAQAALAAAGGLHTFLGLYQGDRRLKARLVVGRWGLTWLLDGEDLESFGKWITAGDKSKGQKAHGLRERPELAPAQARADGRQLVHVRAGCIWGSDARLKFTMEGKNP